ncbi:unnamed protein product [Lactuca saligna]|uniref:Uncharacterized protein n=1 Tax=Lactuca saligna TaxID=75948 RepID=A0AA35YDA1_LACSI|nr:unnamed protein product [Lactuca saligna]
MTSLRSIKHYLLPDQGDFLVHFTDITLDELDKTPNEISVEKLQLSEKLDPETMNLIGEEFMNKGLLLSDSTTPTTSIITGEELRRENMIMKEECQVMREENKIIRQVKKRINAKLTQNKKLYFVLGIGFGVLASTCFSIVILVSS